MINIFYIVFIFLQDDKLCSILCHVTRPPIVNVPLINCRHQFFSSSTLLRSAVGLIRHPLTYVWNSKTRCAFVGLVNLSNSSICSLVLAVYVYQIAFLDHAQLLFFFKHRGLLSHKEYTKAYQFAKTFIVSPYH